MEWIPRFASVWTTLLKASKACAPGPFFEHWDTLRAITAGRSTRSARLFVGSMRGYPFKAGQLEYDRRYSKMPGMPVTGGRGFRGLKPLWYNGVPP
jgi:hypothetical protein